MPKSYLPEGQPRVLGTRIRVERKSEIEGNVNRELQVKIQVSMNLSYGKVYSLLSFCAAEASLAGIGQRVKLYRRMRGI